MNLRFPPEARKIKGRGSGNRRFPDVIKSHIEYLFYMNLRFPPEARKIKGRGSLM